MFVIMDDLHAELHGEFGSREEALAELSLRADLPWDQPPNQCPCTTWRTCERQYVLVDVDTSNGGWTERSRESALTVSATGSRWLTAY